MAVRATGCIPPHTRRFPSSALPHHMAALVYQAHAVPALERDPASVKARRYGGGATAALSELATDRMRTLWASHRWSRRGALSGMRILLGSQPLRHWPSWAQNRPLPDLAQPLRGREP